jgi:hypothetical protein
MNGIGANPSAVNASGAIDQVDWVLVLNSTMFYSITEVPDHGLSEQWESAAN